MAVLGSRFFGRVFLLKCFVVFIVFSLFVTPAEAVNPIELINGIRIVEIVVNKLHVLVEYETLDKFFLSAAIETGEAISWIVDVISGEIQSSSKVENELVEAVLKHDFDVRQMEDDEELSAGAITWKLKNFGVSKLDTQMKDIEDTQAYRDECVSSDGVGVPYQKNAYFCNGVEVSYEIYSQRTGCVIVLKDYLACVCPMDRLPDKRNCSYQRPFYCEMDLIFNGTTTYRDCEEYPEYGTEFKYHNRPQCFVFNKTDTVNLKMKLICYFKNLTLIEEGTDKTDYISEADYAVNQGFSYPVIRKVDDVITYPDGVSFALSSAAEQRLRLKAYNFEKPYSDNRAMLLVTLSPLQLNGSQNINVTFNLSQVSEDFYPGGRIYAEATLYNLLGNLSSNSMLFSSSQTKVKIVKLFLQFDDLRKFPKGLIPLFRVGYNRLRYFRYPEWMIFVVAIAAIGFLLGFFYLVYRFWIFRESIYYQKVFNPDTDAGRRDSFLSKVLWFLLEGITIRDRLSRISTRVSMRIMDVIVSVLDPFLNIISRITRLVSFWKPKRD